MTAIYSFEARGTAYKWLQKVTRFSNTVLNKRIEKDIKKDIFYSLPF